MGTSLTVHGLKQLVKDFAKVVHSTAPVPTPCVANSPKPTTRAMTGKVIFINLTSPSKKWDGIIDYHVKGETDAWVKRVKEDWKKHSADEKQESSPLKRRRLDSLVPSGAGRLVMDCVLITSKPRGYTSS